MGTIALKTAAGFSCQTNRKIAGSGSTQGQGCGKSAKLLRTAIATDLQSRFCERQPSRINVLPLGALPLFLGVE